jgi:hypothetical protein
MRSHALTRLVLWIGAASVAACTPATPRSTADADAGSSGDDVTVPDDSNLLPSDTEESPGDPGDPPTDDGPDPSDDGQALADEGTLPDDEGSPPDDEGSPPDDEGSPPDDEGLPQDGDTGTAPDTGDEGVTPLPCSGPYTITTADDIAAIAHCTEFDGDLTVKNADVTTLDGLDDLAAVHGDLRVVDNDALESIEALGSLTTVDGDLNVSQNPMLTDLDGLHFLADVGGYVLLFKDKALSDISALSSLTAIGGYLEINDCDALSSLAGLDALTTLGEDLDLRDNAALADISALSNLTTIAVGEGGIALSILINASLESLEGLNGVTHIGGKVQILLNTVLSDVSALGNVTAITGDVVISSNPALCDDAVASLVSDIEVSGLVDVSANLDCGPPALDGCQPTALGDYVQGVAIVPANPDDCTDAAIVVSGSHPGTGYGFGTVNTGTCQPPFNCGAIDAVITLNLTATTNPGNPEGPAFEQSFDLGTLEAYTYCVKVIYSAGGGISETILSNLTVSACD